jgi:hypothetical protein
MAFQFAASLTTHITVGAANTKKVVNPSSALVETFIALTPSRRAKEKPPEELGGVPLAARRTEGALIMPLHSPVALRPSLSVGLLFSRKHWM